MQINYMMINSESQLCERTKNKNIMCRKRKKEKLGRKPTFNFSGDFFLKHAIEDNFILYIKNCLQSGTNNNISNIHENNTPRKAKAKEAKRTLANCFKSTIKYSKHLSFSQRI